MREEITIESTGWVKVDLDMVSNYTSDIKIGEKKKDDVENCYTKKITGNLTESSFDDLYSQMKHFANDCDPEECEYCKELD